MTHAGRSRLLTAACAALGLGLAACPPDAARSNPPDTSGSGGGTGSTASTTSTASSAGGAGATSSTGGSGGTSTTGTTTTGGGGSAPLTVLASLSAGDGAEQSGGGVALDDDGAVFWAAQFGGSIVLDGAGLTAAGANDDVLVAKLTAGLQTSWVQPLIGGFLNVGGLALGPAGATVLVGQCAAPLHTQNGLEPVVNSAAGAKDAYAVRFGAAGEAQWAHRHGLGDGTRRRLGSRHRGERDPARPHRRLRRQPRGRRRDPGLGGRQGRLPAAARPAHPVAGPAPASAPRRWRAATARVTPSSSLRTAPTSSAVAIRKSVISVTPMVERLAR